MFAIIEKDSNRVLGSTQCAGLDVGSTCFLVETSLDSVQGYSYDGEIFTQTNPPTPIIFTGVSGDGLKSSNEDFTKVSVYELMDTTFVGTLRIPDDNFEVPLKRDDGRIIIFDAKVRGGVFTVKVNFPTSGVYTYSSEEANSDLPSGTFAVKPVKVKVIRGIPT